ncbi:copper homeostasis periplasmic binding protein CopC [Novosphingobium sp. ERN07]|uniref:copper homeostasis periplasmic binding protein CopC n=1 Tax=Novosphingobium sp. ERN07 TaxID=2726187 RepID=UPI001456F8E0|nr:copper homeostasis periplasmic binding protein CopC [Novosphingobium sp. ERN07]NLR72286.1 copper homeostasis periplasmic binding protein CopC [Novosphingobium sp. ERN07]
MRRLALLAAPLLLALPGTAFAHPKLVSSTPAANTAVAKPTTLSLTFSEDLVGPLSGIELVMTGMPGMANHAPMPIKGFKSETKGKVLTVKLPRALPAGTYNLKWHAVAGDQHRIEGQYAFTVR